jgi:hypothetical protein
MPRTKTVKNYFTDLSNIQRIVLLCAGLFTIFLLRTIMTGPIDLAYDTQYKWQFIDRAARAGVFSLEPYMHQVHQVLRWGMLAPSYLATKIFSTSPQMYLGIPITVFSLTFFLMLWYGRKSLSGVILILFGTLLFFEPYTVRASTVFQPYIFGTFYVFLACLCAIHPSKQWRWTLLVALCCFLAYGTKASYVYFIPGVIAFLYLSKGKQHVYVLCATLTLLICIETLAISSFEEKLPLGRLSAISKKHMGYLEMIAEGKHTPKYIKQQAPEKAKKQNKQAKKIEYDYFTFKNIILFPWSRVGILNQIAGGATLILFLLCLRRRDIYLKKMQPLSQIILLTSISYLFFYTFFVVRFFPPTPAQLHLPRYLTPVFPFLIFSLCVGLNILFSNISKKYKERVQNAVITFCFVFSLISAFYPILTFKYRYNVYPAYKASYWTINTEVQNLHSWLAAGNGIITSKTTYPYIWRWVIRAAPNKKKKLALKYAHNARGKPILHSASVKINTIKNCIYLNEGSLTNYRDTVPCNSTKKRKRKRKRKRK